MQTRPLNPNQLTAARLLLHGYQVRLIAEFLDLHPYTVSRWKRDPRFQAELRRQTDLGVRHTAQQGATKNAPAQNEPTQVSPTTTDNGLLSKDNGPDSTPPTPLLYSPVHS